MTENRRCIKTGKIDETKFKKYRKIPVTIEAYQSDKLNELYEENTDLKQQLQSYKKESEINYNTLEQIHTILKKWEGCPYEQ